MDVLKAEMERKRKEREEAAAAAGGGGKKKWLKRGEVEKLRQEAYHAAEAKEAEERKAKLVVPCLKYKNAKEQEEGLAELRDAADGRGKDGGGEGSGVGKASGKGGVAQELQPAEVKRLLRQLGQPIALFGEEDADRLERYKAVSAAVPSINEEHLELKQGQMFNETQLYDEAGRAKQEGVQKEHEDEEADLVLQGDEELEAAFTPTTPEQIVSRHFKQLIKLWETQIGARPEAEAKSVDGRKEMSAYLQCRRHMKPFFKQLKSRSMNIEVLNTMIEITQYSQQRDYVKAHDAYIRCAIGNAPWPMGISGTGIHERQGRQHIRESKLAHIMNDETQRKYLQSVKRLLTFSQRALPAEGPSKMVT